ncbi:MAG: hypothetical protein JSV23_02430 [Promethearchaeota archaeon]|nr:MAG: hypothetical protein JSV23_02430 [Candidatus Lokiarchaeota archaeon]
MRKNNINKKNVSIVKKINIGLLIDGTFMDFGINSFKELTDKKYDWTIDNITYKFDIKTISDDQIINGELDENGKLKHINVIILGGADKYIKLYYWSKYLKNKYNKWRNNLRDFIQKKGGGCVCICGGSETFCLLDCDKDTHISFNEKMMKETSVDATNLTVKTKTAFPLLNQLPKSGNPNDLGHCAYLVYPGQGGLTGATLDFRINKNSFHPILKGYNGDSIQMRWAGGPTIHNYKNESVILHYPDRELSELHPIKQWKYVGTGSGGQFGKWTGLLKSINNELKYDNNKKMINKEFKNMLSGSSSVETFINNIFKNSENESQAKNLFEKIYDGILKAKDWNIDNNNVITTELAGQAAIVAENSEKGRIVISGPHPELPIWNNGWIAYTKNSTENCLWDSFYKWKDYSIQDRRNYWLFCRIVAWAAGLNENELPPFPEYNRDKTQGGDDDGKGVDKDSWISTLIDFLKRLFRIKS